MKEAGDHGRNKRNNCDHTRDPDEVTRILRPMHLDIPQMLLSHPRPEFEILG